VKVVCIIAAALICATAAMGDVIFRQDFEGTKFPPTFWYVDYGNWTTESVGGNHYAHGWIHAKSGSSGSRLGSRQFWGRYNWKIKVSFRYQAWKTGDFLGDIVDIDVWGKNSFRKELTYSRNWRRFSWVTPELGNGSHYRVFFFTGGNTAEGKEGRIYFNVDDVRVEYCDTAVSPTSLGRVKALYR
jgi:hypothetical protein